MKEKLKNAFLGCSVIYVISITLLVICNFLTASKTIDLKDSDDNLKKLSELKTEMNLLEESECKNLINDFIKYYEKTSYDGVVVIKDMYELVMDENLLSYYMEVDNACNVSASNINHTLANKVVASSLQMDRIFVKDFFKYEITLKDKFNRMIIEPSFYNQEYIISKYNQLEIIETLINLVKEEK